MAFMANEITFGDFDKLTQEEDVYHILYGPRQAGSGGVEFPWDSKEYNSCGNIQEEAALYDYQHGEQYPTQQNENVNNAFPINNDQYVQFTFEGSDTNRSHQSKPYERRNKKRRPPGYYEKLQEEIEAERVHQPVTNARADTEMSTSEPMYEDMTYSSQSEKDTHSTDYRHTVNHSYDQKSTLPHQNQYRTVYNDNVDTITENISHVTLTNDSLAHSHMVHTTHEHYPPSTNFQPTPVCHSDTSFHPQQNSAYPQSKIPSDSVGHASQEEHNTYSVHTTDASHISESSFYKPQSGSSSSGFVEQDTIKQEVDNCDQNQTNVLDNMENETENVVDFASYPPLQATSNSIPIVSATTKDNKIEECVEIPVIHETSSSQQEESSTDQGSVWGKPKSWANLFKGESTSASSVIYNNENFIDVDFPDLDQENASKNKQIIDTGPVPAIHDSAADILGDIFCQYKIIHSQVGLQPRGLINRGNWCYINATLQALISCPPFYNLIKKIPVYSPLQRGPTSTPILDSMIRFVGEFTPCARSTDRSKGKRTAPELPPGPVFEPTYVYKMLQLLQDTATFKLGKQEDAEEFLSCILDGMHEEMLACMRVHKGEDSLKEYETNGILDNSGEEDVDADSWEQVGPKKKTVLTRKNDFAGSPLADIFVGYVRSAVYKTTSKESATVEPFFTLKLDIQSDKVSTVREALERMVSKESVSGFTCSKTNAELEVTKRLTLEQLPPVLILHLKCFVYDKDGGSQKLIKDVNFTIELEITKDLLSPNVKGKYQSHQRIYKLFAVVYHHGKKATGGHYTTAVFHPAINRWVSFDDSNVKIVPVTQVLQFSAPRVPYLLYYRRVDLH